MRIFTCFALAILSQCFLIPLCGQLPYTACEPYPLAGSTTTVFDWRAPTYTFYMQGQTGATQVTSPFWLETFPLQENVSHLSGVPQDFEPDDGWELVVVNFGTESKKAETPTLVLYNRLNGVMRVFQYAKGDLDTYQSATLNLSQYIDDGNFENYSSVFEHMSIPMSALDNFAKGISIDAPNRYYNFVLGSENRTWLFSEFVTAYDPCSCSHITGMRVQPSFTQITTIDLSITGQGTTVPVYTPSEPRNGFSAALSGASDAVSAFAQGGKTYKELGAFQDFLADIGMNAPNLNTIGTAIKTLDLLINNDKAPSIASYDSEFVFEATGNLSKVDMADASLFKTPGGLDLPNIPPGIDAGQTVYDAPLGVFNLMKSPRVQVNILETEPLRTMSFKLDDDYDPQYVFNQAAGFKMEASDVRFQLVFDDCIFDDPSIIGSPPSGLSPTGIEGRFATPLMPIECLKDYTVTFLQVFSPSFTSWCSGPPRLKVVTTLTNEDTPSSTSYAASYSMSGVDITLDPLPPNPYLDIPDITTISYEDFDPRKDLESWDKVIIQNVPITVIIDPQNPNIQTLIPDTYDPNDVPFVGVFPGDLNETYDVIFEGLPPCAYTQPASAEDIAEFCMNDYNPSAGLVDDEEPLSLQSAPAAPPQPAEQPRIKLYPQPASDWAQLELPDGQDRGRLLVMDAYGQTVLAQDIRSPHIQLNIAALPAGLYILSIDLLDGQPPYTERLAKQ